MTAGGPRARRVRAARGWRGRVAALVRALHRVLGAPDYEAYLAHHRRAHPGTPPLSYDAFARRRYEERARGAGSRCC